MGLATGDVAAGAAHLGEGDVVAGAALGAGDVVAGAALGAGDYLLGAAYLGAVVLLAAAAGVLAVRRALPGADPAPRAVAGGLVFTLAFVGAHVVPLALG